MSYVQLEESIGFGCHPQHGPMVLRQVKLENSNLPTWQILSPVNPWGKFWNLPFIVYWQRGWMTVFATVLTKKTCVENSQQLVATLRYCWGRIRASLLMCKNHIKGCQRVYYIHTDICCVYFETYISIYIYSTYVYNIYIISYMRSTSTGGNFFHQQYTQVMQQKIGRLQPPLREAMRPRSVPRSMGAYAPARGW